MHDPGERPLVKIESPKLFKKNAFDQRKILNIYKEMTA